MTTNTIPGTAASGARSRRSPDSEAAAYRVRLAAVHTQIETTTALIAATRRATVEEVAAGGDVRLNRSGDLWDILKADPEAFYDAAGTIDRDALTGYLQNIPADRAYLLAEWTPEAAPPAGITLATLTAAHAAAVSNPFTQGEPQ